MKLITSILFSVALFSLSTSSYPKAFGQEFQDYRILDLQEATGEENPLQVVNMAGDNVYTYNATTDEFVRWSRSGDVRHLGSVPEEVKILDFSEADVGVGYNFYADGSECSVVWQPGSDPVAIPMPEGSLGDSRAEFILDSTVTGSFTRKGGETRLYSWEIGSPIAIEIPIPRRYEDGPNILGIALVGIMDSPLMGTTERYVCYNLWVDLEPEDRMRPFISRTRDGWDVGIVGDRFNAQLHAVSHGGSFAMNSGVNYSVYSASERRYYDMNSLGLRSIVGIDDYGNTLRRVSVSSPDPYQVWHPAINGPGQPRSNFHYYGEMARPEEGWKMGSDGSIFGLIREECMGFRLKFWNPYNGPEGVRGDMNRDGTVSIADPISLLTLLFGGVCQIPCEEEADVDGDEEILLTDAIYTLRYLFLGGPPPIGPPGPLCLDPPDGS
jgi:hypothetical protein